MPVGSSHRASALCQSGASLKVQSRLATNDDAAMISSLASRLSQVEKLNARQAATIAQKSAEVDRLKLENSALKQAGAADVAQELLDLQKEKHGSRSASRR